MTTHTFPSLSAELAHRVDEFESALAADPDTDFARFLPAPGHPLYPAVLGELVRVDQEHAWSHGRPRRLAGAFQSLLNKRSAEVDLLAGSETFCDMMSAAEAHQVEVVSHDGRPDGPDVLRDPQDRVVLA